MEPLRLFWLWIVVGMVLSSLVIVLVFIIINKCISWKAGNYQPSSTPQTDFYADSRPYHTRDIESDVPPLPPRDMFESSDSVNQYEPVDLPEYLKVVEDERPQTMYDQPDIPKSKEALEDQDASTEEYDDVMPPPGYDSDYDDVG
ncbi:hypothetical protein AALO_G00021390 [Alosa alosa]|uniref:SLP adapter and CSK-interacting membrane protein n=1 Tax=Alosa alosa TaxID=278164 RepID=A0AAV6HDM0_9TELE|nr:hypothetical protein AALO_G00021390 [Alosa alosa]